MKMKTLVVKSLFKLAIKQIIGQTIVEKLHIFYLQITLKHKIINF
jgi:hypothetical protein